MIWYLILAYLVLGILVWLIGKIGDAWRYRGKSQLRTTAGLFINNYVDGKALFVARYGKLPSIGVITHVDATAAFALVNDSLAAEVVDIHQLNMYDHDEARACFSVTILELTGVRMIEIGNGYVELLHTSTHYAWAMQLLQNLAECKIDTEPVEEARAPTIIGFARAMEMN
jgi:hypothetical protein